MRHRYTDNLHDALFFFLLFFIAIGAATAQSAQAAQYKYVAIKASGSGYSFAQYPTAGAVPIDAKESESGGWWGNTTLRAVGSDGDRWYAITRGNNVNCFYSYTSYKNFIANQTQTASCTPRAGDGYRGLTSDGRQFYTVYWDGTKNIWQTYSSWNNVINNYPTAQVLTGSVPDIYKSIGYDYVTRTFFTLAQGWGNTYLFNYSDFNQMVAIRQDASKSFVYSTPTRYAGLVLAPVNETVDLYIMAGQSNMVGYEGDAALLIEDRADWAIGYSAREGYGLDTSVSTTGGITTLRPLVNNYAPWLPPKYNFGPEMSFGRSLYNGGRRNFVIMKYAMGNTSLAFDWNPSRAAPPINLFNVLKQELATTTAQWNSYGPGLRVKIAGFIWMQGEADSQNIDFSNQYLRNLRNLKETVRALAGDPNLPFVVGRISQWDVWTYRAVVRAAQQQVASEDYYARLVNTDDLNRVPADLAHYDSYGLYTMGIRMADSIRNIAGK